MATLDELTGGRAECVISSGNFGLLAQYHIEWAKTKPLSRVKEAHHVMRTLLDEGAITHEGEFYNYSGLFTFARPVQEHLPLKMGVMRGPKSFEAAGEISDGAHHALSYTREAYDYFTEHVRVGAERAGRDWKSLDLAAWVVFAVGRDSEGGQGGRAQHGGPVRVVDARRSSSSATMSTRHDLGPVIEALGKADMPGAIEATSPEIAEKLSIAGTPEECVAKIKSEIEPSGVNHMILAITDDALVKALMGRDLDNVADVKEQLQLVHDDVMPAFA